VLIDEWKRACERHRWAIGHYVIMPDHVHFFCRPEREAKNFVTVRRGLEDMDEPKDPKSQTAADGSGYNSASSLATRILDHLLRSSESYSEKWNYVRENPVRSGFVTSADDWPYSGEIERLEF
jgi:REP-associated tyrosine transposase